MVDSGLQYSFAWEMKPNLTNFFEISTMFYQSIGVRVTKKNQNLIEFVNAWILKLESILKSEIVWYTQCVPIRNGVVRTTSENLIIFRKQLVKFSDIRNKKTHGIMN